MTKQEITLKTNVAILIEMAKKYPLPTEMKIGNTIIKIDTSYVDTLTPEQAMINDDIVNDAVWAMYDEMEKLFP
jgi:hypothetical protein